MVRYITLGKFRGIPLEVRPSAFILVGMIVVITTIMGTMYDLPFGFGSLDLPLIDKVFLGSVCATAIFLSIIMHEMAHSMAALWKGHVVKNISVTYFGGEAKIGDTWSHDYIAGEEIIAFMGPLSNLVIGSAFWGASFLLSLSGSAGSMEVLITLLGVLGFYNVLFGLFNLLPGYPLDGGLMLRSFLSRRMDQENTMMTAVKVCRVSAMIIGLFGLLQMNILVLAIAAFLYLTAYIECPEFNYKVE